MFAHPIQHHPKNETQAEIDAATLRTMIDFSFVINAESEHLVARRPFRLDTNFGKWTGAFLPDLSGAVAVQCEMTGDVINPNTRLGRDTSWLLKQVGIYGRRIHAGVELERSAREAQESGELIRTNGCTYCPAHIISFLRALGAPDSRGGYGHFTYNATMNGVQNPQLLALSGTVARRDWRAFLLPCVERLTFLDRGEISLGEIE